MNGRVRFKRGAYNLTSDAVWLAAFAEPAKTVLDVGVGTGGVALCFLSHCPDAAVTGLDISTDMLTTCAENAELNDRDLELINADILTWRTSRTFDLVVSNPPYFKGTPAKHGAHHNVDLTKWAQKCIARVRPGGQFCTIIDAATIDEIISAIRSTGCGDITIFPLFGAKSTAERVMISARVGSRGHTRLFSGLPMNYDPVLRDGLTIATTLDTLWNK